jgi:hypothetical protein
MSKYYFDFRPGLDERSDRAEIGVEFATADQARRGAIKALVEVARDEVSRLDAGQELSVHVRDADRPICTLTLTLSAN